MARAAPRAGARRRGRADAEGPEAAERAAAREAGQGVRAARRVKAEAPGQSVGGEMRREIFAQVGPAGCRKMACV